MAGSALGLNLLFVLPSLCIFFRLCFEKFLEGCELFALQFVANQTLK